MSEQSTSEDRPHIDLMQDNVAFGALMDALVPPEPAEGGQTAPDGAAAPTPGAVPSDAPGGPDAPSGGNAAAGQPAPVAGAPADGAPAPAGGPAEGGAGQPPAASQPADPGNAGPDAAVIIPKIGELSTQFEQSVTKAFQKDAYDATRADYGNYFEALEKHPRLLVGTQVPAIGKDGMETLKNSEDAKEWQEAVKSLLVQEIQSRATAKLDESRDFIETIHASIDLFKNNVDLIPGTKGFNRELADAFAKMAEPYEIRDEDDEKLVGYSIPVQPIIDQLRTQLAAAKAPAAPAPAAAPAVMPPVPAEPPQAAVTSKAGNSAEKDDFSTLFGTIGLPNLQI